MVSEVLCEPSVRFVGTSYDTWCWKVQLHTRCPPPLLKAAVPVMGSMTG